MMVNRLIYTIISVMWLSACAYQTTEDLCQEQLGRPCACDLDSVRYSRSIKPLLQSNCALSGCHSGPDAEQGWDFATYPAAQEASTQGMLQALRHEPGFSPMPRNAAQLSACDIAKVERWIQNGAKKRLAINHCP
ncbi:MAG: hypothetical protein HC842_06440 [Cytophagales bacterium]|nr:hypothetical protein [Cytophagales bacterium]